MEPVTRNSLLNFVKNQPELFGINEFLDETMSHISFKDFLYIVMTNPDVYLKMSSNNIFWRRYYKENFSFDPVNEVNFKGSYFYECIRATFPEVNYYLSAHQELPLSEFIPKFQNVQDQNEINLLHVNPNNKLPFDIKDYKVDTNHLSENVYYLLLENGDLQQIYYDDNQNLISRVIRNNIKNIVSVISSFRYRDTIYSVNVIVLLSYDGNLSSIYYDSEDDNNFERKILDFNQELKLDNIKDEFQYLSNNNSFSGNKGNKIYRIEYIDNILTFIEIDYTNITNDLQPIKFYQMINVFTEHTRKTHHAIYVVNSEGKVSIISFSKEIAMLQDSLNVNKLENIKDIFIFYHSEYYHNFIFYRNENNQCFVHNVNFLTYDYENETYPLDNMFPGVKFKDIFVLEDSYGRTNLFLLDDKGYLYEYDYNEEETSDPTIIKIKAGEFSNQIVEQIRKDDGKILPGVEKVFISGNNPEVGIIFKRIERRGRYVLFPYNLYLLYELQGYVTKRKLEGNEIYFMLTKSTYSFVTVINEE